MLAGLSFFICFFEGRSLAEKELIQKRLRHDGLARSYHLYIPDSYNGLSPVPLVFVLHGGGGNGENASRMSHMNDQAEKRGFIAVYPNGTGGKFLRGRLLTWNAWNCCGQARSRQVRDVDFFKTLIQALKEDYVVDNRRIYATGFSNGAMMVHRLAVELPDLFAAIAPVAGALNGETLSDLSSPVAVMMFHGKQDQHVLYEGGAPKIRADRSDRTDKPVSYAVDYWVNQNRCSPDARVEKTGAVTREFYGGCDGGAEVILYTLENQGHAWPGGRSGLRFGNVDPPSPEISATVEIVKFFLRHQKPAHDNLR